MDLRHSGKNIYMFECIGQPPGMTIKCAKHHHRVHFRGKDAHNGDIYAKVRLSFLILYVALYFFFHLIVFLGIMKTSGGIPRSMRVYKSALVVSSPWPCTRRVQKCLVYKVHETSRERAQYSLSRPMRSHVCFLAAAAVF